MQSLLKEWWLLVLHWKPKPSGCGQLSHSTLSECLSVNFSYLDWEATPKSSSPTKPQHHQQSWGQVTHLSRQPSLRTWQGQSRRVPLAVLFRKHWLSWHKLTSPSNYLGGQTEKSWIVSPFLPIAPIFYLSSGWIPPSPCPQLAPPGSVLLTLAPPPQGQAKLLQ